MAFACLEYVSVIVAEWVSVTNSEHVKMVPDKGAVATWRA